MANERTYSCLPCRDIDESVAFYESLGFAVVSEPYDWGGIPHLKMLAKAA